MRKLILGLAVAATGLTAVPAAAQSWRLQPAVHRQIQQDIKQIDRRIDRAEARGAISHREANGLERDARQLKRLYYRYSRNGLNRVEVTALERQINRLHQRLRLERRDWDGRRG
jgi:hypothetical protein